MDDIIQIPDDKETFRLEDWIGQGRRVPSAIPDGLGVYFENKLALPPDIQEQYLPDANLSVNEFLSFTLLRQKAALITIKVMQAFSNHAANQAVSCLHDRTIPSRQFIISAGEAVQQAILDGAASVIDPRYKGGRLPLWTITLWQQAQVALDAQQAWQEASTWLQKQKRSASGSVQQAVDEVEDVLDHLAWNTRTTVLKSYTTTSSFAKLISDRMISTTVVDMMTQWVVEQVQADDSLQHRFEVAGIPLSEKLLGFVSHRAFEVHTSAWLEKLEHALREGKTVLFPVYIKKKQHFVAMKIDGVTRTYSYGDSLYHQGYRLPVDVKRKVEWWLTARVGAFEWMDCSLSSGYQDDELSCGVCAVNTVAHAAMGEELWLVENKVYERLQWFRRIVAPHLKLAEPSLLSNGEHLRQPGIPRGMEQLLSHNNESYISDQSRHEEFSDIPHSPDDIEVTRPTISRKGTSNTSAPSTNPRRTSIDSSIRHYKDPGSCTPRSSSSDSGLPDEYQWEQSASSEAGWEIDVPCPSNTDVSMQGVSEGYTTDLGDEAEDSEGRSLGLAESSDMANEDTEGVEGRERRLDDMQEEAASSSHVPLKIWPIFNMNARSQVVAKNKETGNVETRKRTLSKVSSSRLLDEDNPKRSKASHTAVHKRPQRAPPLPLGIKTKDDGRPDPVGNSRSAVRTRIEKDAIAAGTFVLKQSNYDRFKKSIIDKHDAYALFDPRDPLAVRHSKCGEWIRMRQPYNTVNFSLHVHGTKTQKPCNEGPKTKLTGGNTKTLESVWDFSSTGKSDAMTSSPKIDVPCPGLRATKWPKIDTYLKRTYALGGGGPSVGQLVEEYYPEAEDFAGLAPEQKELLRNLQETRWRWLNKKGPDRVVSVTCAHVMHVAEGTDEKDIPVCNDCDLLLKDKGFNNSLRVKLPDDENMKYVPKVHREADKNAIQRFGHVSGLKEIIEANQENAQEPCVVFAKWVLAGHFEAENVFVSLVKAMVSKKERELNGLGMEGFRYPPDVMELAHILVIHSPRAYQAIRNVLPVPTDRTLGRQRAREIRFPVGIQDRNLELAEEHMKKLNYSGPVGLSCDDTKLLLSLGSYFDAERKGWYLLGSTGEPMLIADPEGLAREIQRGLIEKADKLRLWTLQIPLPGVPTIILAAKAIRDNLSADVLIEYSAQLLFGLLDRGIKVVGYVADGAATERKVQRQLTGLASSVRDHHIPHPGRARQPINLRIPLFGTQQQPVAMIQDSNHGRKTYRNNKFSNSRLMILGDYVTMYSHTRTIAVDGGPLFMRDVEKVDRQDDGAATCLFSGHTLRWLVDHHPDWLGTIIYLFVFGELIDAYQSRSMSITDRVYLALRALFFMEMWEEFLDKMGYPKGKHFLSHEAVDITYFLIYGLLQLVIIYRDDLDGKYPLLPWLLSTEPCEHVFGLCRQIIKDFTMLDFQYMVPKLYIRLREHFFFNHTSDGKARASGYNHTYTDAHGIDLTALSTFPSDEEIENVSHAAYEEACGLWDVLGVPRASNNGLAASRLPHINSWFPGADILLEAEDDDHYNGDNEPDGAELDRLMRVLEDESASDSQEEAKWNGLAYAAAALTVQNTMTICELPEDDGGREEEIAHIGSALASCLAGVHDPNEHANLSDAQLSSMDLDALVSLRLKHQTKYADKGVRGRRQHAKVGDDGEADSTQLALPRSDSESAMAGDIDSSKAPSGTSVLAPNVNLCNEYRLILKDRADRGIGTGAVRNLRWTTHGSEDPLRGMSAVATAPAAGTAANAAQVATGVASKLQTRRTAIVKKHKLPTVVAKANLTEEHPLHTAEGSDKDGGGYGLVLYQENIWLAKFLTISSKTAGKNARHAWIPDAHKITAISNLGAQVFRPVYGRQFSAITPGCSNIRFALLKSTEFLYSLSSLPQPMGQHISVLGGDGEIFAALRQQTLKAIIAAVKELNGRQTNQGTQVDDNDD